MQGTVFDIKRFAVHDGPGIRTTIFLKGCPLKCSWCHNPEGIDPVSSISSKVIKIDGIELEKQEITGTQYHSKELMEIIRKDQIFLEESEGGVTFSGGEPSFQSEFLVEMLKACQAEGLHTAVDTCGYMPEHVLKMLLPFTSLFLYDLKHVNPNKHKAYTGAKNNIILQNLHYLMKHRIPVRIRIPVIPGFNNSIEELSDIITFLKILPVIPKNVDLLPYHKMALHKYNRLQMPDKMEGTPVIIESELHAARNLFLENGFNVSIGG